MPNELSHRGKIAQAWKNKLTRIFPEGNITIPENFFRIIITGINRENTLKTAKQAGFDLGEWDGEPIAPRGVDLKKFGYTFGECPHAEKFIKNYVTFPTNRRTTVSDVERFVRIFEI